MLISTAATRLPPSRILSATRTNSSTVFPAIEAITVTPRLISHGRSSLMKFSTPLFWIPIALSIPDGVSHMRGVGFPFHGTSVMDLTMIPPRRVMSMNAAPSRPAPKVPDATRTGLSRLRAPSFVERSTLGVLLFISFSRE
jgi:hypothetical protein